MSTDWQPGDGAECIDDRRKDWLPSGPHNKRPEITTGAIYTVIAVRPHIGADGGWTTRKDQGQTCIVLLEAKHPGNTYGGYAFGRFRKLPPLISEQEREETLELTGRE